VLARDDRRGDLIGVGQAGKLPVTVNREDEERHRSGERAAKKEEAGSSLGHG
jgi:hypothetical protein